MSSWGVLIKDGAEKMEGVPWLLEFPAALFSLTLFSLNFLGDGCATRWTCAPRKID
jgi:oligopeptide transport system permease protein